jgi:hypothetical protein
VLATHVVRAWGDASKRRSAQHDAALAEAEQVREVCGSVVELPDFEGSHEIREAGAEKSVDARPVEILTRTYGPGRTE